METVESIKKAGRQTVEDFPDHKEAKQQRDPYLDIIYRHGVEILRNKKHQGTANQIQHGRVSVRLHSINVARTSLKINRRWGLGCNERALVRGALLHDFFLYDWHDKDHINPFRLHGFFHPGIALRNAEQEFSLTNRERDIIGKHMWPLTVVPPYHREAWVVTMADKYCSLVETIKMR